MQTPNEQPERLIRPAPAPTSSGGGLQMSGGIRQIIIMAIIAIVVSFGLAVAWILPQTESVANFKANIGPMITDITTLKNTQKGDEGTIATLSTQITGVSKQIQDLQSSLNTLSTTVASHTSQINAAPTRAQLDALQTQITTLTNKVAALPDVTALKADIAALQTSLDAVKADVTVLKTAPTVPVNQPPTMTGFSPTSGTSGTSVVITGTNFNAASAVSFGGTAASSFTVNSGTQITAVVGNGSTGAVSVTTSAGTASLASVPFTYTGSVPANTGVSTTFIPSSIFGVPNTITLTITNNSGKDIFGGQFSLTVQYLDATPTTTNMIGLTSTGATWGPTGTISGMSVTIVGTAQGFFVLNGQSKIITVNVAPPTTGTQFRVTSAIYSGYVQ